MVTLFLLVSAISILFTLSMVMGWSGIRSVTTSNKPGQDHYISVIVPIRNEEANIGQLLRDLVQQDYPQKLMEVLLIDDHSIDNTRNVVQSLKDELAGNFILALNEGEGKKAAIETGIRLSKGELIMTTDGDCRVDRSWITSILTTFKDSELLMSSGPVVYEGSGNLWNQILMMEFAALQGIGAVTMSWNQPTMCNGANLAYTKHAFARVNGYNGNQNIPSGDDEFLMHSIVRELDGKVRFMKDHRAIVRTRAVSDLHGFFNQRLRWASKWRNYRNKAPRLIALLVMLINVNVILGLGLLIAGELSLPLFMLAFVLKITTDFWFVRTVNKFLGCKSNPFLFVLMEIFYPLYAIVFGIFGLLGNYTWKGRKYKQA